MENIQETFNEAEWLKILFLLSDTDVWLHGMEKRLLYTVPFKGKSKLLKTDFYITASSLAHILERHYYKIARHPEASKFTVSVAEILELIRQAKVCPVIPIPGRNRFYRIMDAEKVIGIDTNGSNTATLAVVTDAGGHIITAYPGTPTEMNYDGE
jgi:hypothetical protein